MDRDAHNYGKRLPLHKLYKRIQDKQVNFFGFHDGMMNIGEDMIRCRVCGHIFYHVWAAPGKVAVERFPIECPQCGRIEGYRMSDEERAELLGDDE